MVIRNQNFVWFILTTAKLDNLFKKLCLKTLINFPFEEVFKENNRPLVLASRM